jgi:hypothetical protein
MISVTLHILSSLIYKRVFDINLLHSGDVEEWINIIAEAGGKATLTQFAITIRLLLMECFHS